MNFTNRPTTRPNYFPLPVVSLFFRHFPVPTTLPLRVLKTLVLLDTHHTPLSNILTFLSMPVLCRLFLL